MAPEISSLELLRPILTELITARIGVPRTVAEELHALLNNAEIKVWRNQGQPQGADPSPFPIPHHVGTAGKNYLNVEITPLLSTGIGERYCQSI